MLSPNRLILAPEPPRNRTHSPSVTFVRCFPPWSPPTEDDDDEEEYEYEKEYEDDEDGNTTFLAFN
jgi:hypothetical protein